MQRARGHFLAGAGFAGDQNRGAAGPTSWIISITSRIALLEPTNPRAQSSVPRLVVSCHD